MGWVTPVSAAVALLLPNCALALQLTPVDSPLLANAKRVEAPVNPQPKVNVTQEMRGDIYMARKQYRDAVEAYEQCPQSAVIVNKIGIAYHQMLELDAAKKQYERAIKMNPRYAEALNNLGTVYYAKKSYRRAIGQYKKALKLAPDSASIYSNLGTAYWARKKYDQAMKAYEQALALDPEVFEHRSTAGVLLQERPIEERAKFHFYQAKLYAKQGITDRALLCLRKALEEGYKDRDKIAEQPEFKDMLNLPEFKELIAYRPRVL
ncbi:MAG TPA: tetratricopeptide repeat protein [Bryobacteraceae bacterium]|jgi:tetratricopeptide (TPR) repeat protein|nr:tetratricopeptide repeat protein [Bryobacteraceae bacterium]